MILTHTSGWNQAGELWLALLCSANNWFQQKERELSLIDRSTGQKSSFPAHLVNRVYAQ